MGCGSSTSGPGGGPRKRGSATPLSAAELAGRTEASGDAATRLTCGGVALRYACLSQRGYYPDDPSKANQDAYVATRHFAGRPDAAFFGVFDGHGRDGDKCAQFVRDRLPPLLSQAAAGGRRGKEATREVLERAHEDCHAAMHAAQGLDDALSGTTAISLYLDGGRNRLTVSNVGDSRAVAGRRAAAATGGQEEGAGVPPPPPAPPPPPGGVPAPSPLKAYALSQDQTPYRLDERVRIRRTGARVLSLDQIEGLEPVRDDEAERDERQLREGGGPGGKNGGGGGLVLGGVIDEAGDPPRVWSPDGDYPGTAFSRSLGDSVAKKLGVVATPEVVTREVTPEDRIIVLASDGVFEFLTNQSVIDMCAKFEDPLEACRAVVAESYELWLQYELRTDDITMICIFVDAVTTAPPAPAGSSGAGDPGAPELAAAGATSEEPDAALPREAARPVRKGMSAQKSRALAALKSKTIQDVTAVDEDDDFDVVSLYTEKTDEQKAQIDAATRALVAFQNLTTAHRELIYQAMEPMETKAGQWIIRQGTAGDRFYVVEEGTFEVRILPEGREDPEGTGGDVVHVYAGSRASNAHPGFGELALRYSAPRAASVIARTDGRLWALHRYAFKQITEGNG